MNADRHLNKVWNIIDAAGNSIGNAKLVSVLGPGFFQAEVVEDSPSWLSKLWPFPKKIKVYSSQLKRLDGVIYSEFDIKEFWKDSR